MKTNINNLTTDRLNTLAALGQGWQIETCQIFAWLLYDTQDGHTIRVDNYDPCHNWNQAGALVEKYSIGVEGGSAWLWNDRGICIGVIADTPTLAVTRAFVASVYGIEVDYE